MNDFPWLSTLGLLPFVGAAVVAFVPKGRETLAKQIALGFSLVVLAVTVAMALQFDASASAPFQFVESHVWIKQFGISYALGVDGIALVLIALLTSLVPVVILAGWHDADTGRHSVQTYFALFLALEGTVVFVFATTDLFLFYVAFEVMLLPVYFLIGMFGGAQRTYAAVKFLLYSLFGGLILLAGLISLYVISAQQLPHGTFDVTALAGLSIDPTTQKWLFAAFFFAFAVKAPMFPVHTWLPDAAAAGTPGTNTLVVGVLDKVGTFGMIRLCLPLFPDASQWAAPFVVALAAFSVVYAGLVAIGQTDMNRIVAYVSVSHFGVIVLGIFAFTTLGGSGSTFYMVAHGLSAAALFLIVGFLVRRRGSAQIGDFGGVARVAPMLAGVFLAAGLSSLAMPGMAGFVGELTSLVGSFPRWPGAAVVSVLGIVLSALYILQMYKRVAQGPKTDQVSSFVDLGPREAWVVAPVLALTIALGVFPQPIFDVVNPAVDRILEQVSAPVIEPSVSALSTALSTPASGTEGAQP
ncbi:MAG: NADH-quinone oxidoreductase subunit M [Actinomycetes bacterium]